MKKALKNCNTGGFFVSATNEITNISRTNEPNELKF
jgi:hypothetical protein